MDGVMDGVSRPRVFVTQPVAQSAIDRLAAVADVRVNPDALRVIDHAALCAQIADCDILFCLLHDRIDQTVIDAAPHLRAIASMKITPSDIDLAAASARRIPVTVIPPIVTEATADIAMALLLAVARRVVEGDRLVRQGIFPGSQSSHLEAAMVTGRTLGLVGGGGRIGRAVARRAQGFAMRVLYWGPRRLPQAEEEAAFMRYVGLDELLAESDFVSLHSPLTAETFHQIGARELGLMKSSAFLINTSRGAIVDEAALARALGERRIAGAGLDVFEAEPVPNAALLALPNTVLTPHLGSAVAILREQMAHVVVDNILAVLHGTPPPNCCNPEVLQMA
jgi:glyoxylate reductase